MEGGGLPGEPQGLGRLIAADRIRLAYDVVVQPSAGGLVEGGDGGDVGVIGLVHDTSVKPTVIDVREKKVLSLT